MKNRFVIALVTVFLVSGSLAVVCAQQDQGQPAPNVDQPGGGRWGGPNGGGHMQMPEGFRNTMQLMRLPRQISELNKDKKTALTPGQAKQILAIVKPLRSKSKLPSDQAKLVSEKIHKVLTGAQIDAMSSQRGFGHGGGRRGGGRQPEGGWKPRDGVASTDKMAPAISSILTLVSTRQQ